MNASALTSNIYQKDKTGHTNGKCHSIQIKQSKHKKLFSPETKTKLHIEHSFSTILVSSLVQIRSISEANPERRQTCKMGNFVKIAHLLTISIKSSIIDIQLGTPLHLGITLGSKLSSNEHMMINLIRQAKVSVFFENCKQFYHVPADGLFINRP